MELSPRCRGVLVDALDGPFILRASFGPIRPTPPPQTTVLPLRAAPFVASASTSRGVAAPITDSRSVAALKALARSRIGVLINMYRYLPSRRDEPVCSAESGPPADNEPLLPRSPYTPSRPATHMSSPRPPIRPSVATPVSLSASPGTGGDRASPTEIIQGFKPASSLILAQLLFSKSPASSPHISTVSRACNYLVMNCNGRVTQTCDSPKRSRRHPNRRLPCRVALWSTLHRRKSHASVTVRSCSISLLSLRPLGTLFLSVPPSPALSHAHQAGPALSHVNKRTMPPTSPPMHTPPTSLPNTWLSTLPLCASLPQIPHPSFADRPQPLFTPTAGSVTPIT